MLKIFQVGARDAVKYWHALPQQLNEEGIVQLFQTSDTASLSGSTDEADDI